MNLIPISKKDKLANFGVFLSRDRLIKLWRGNRYPGLFVKLFGRIYIDVDLLHTAISQPPCGGVNVDNNKTSNEGNGRQSANKNDQPIV